MTNYGTLNPEYPTGKFKPVTAKGRKREVIESLEKTLKEKEEQLKKYQDKRKAKQDNGKDLDADDLKRLTRLTGIVNDMRTLINTQKQMFNIK